MSFFFQLTLVSSVAKRKLLVKWKSLIINFWGLWCELKVIKFYLAFTCVCVCVCVWCNYWKILKCKISLLGTVVISRNDMALFDVLNQWSTVAPLQWVQNSAARLVLGLSPCDHVSQALTDLHWLPVRYRMQYKLALMMYMAHTGQTTSYTKDAVTPISQDPARHCLRSADTTDYAVPRTRTKFGERAFYVAGMSTWNSLPESLRKTDCTQTFKRRLKTYFLASTSALLSFKFSLFYWLL